MYCFDKTRRLLNKTEYDYVFDQAKKIVTTEFIILYRDNMIGQARLGLALSKKMISKAHHRNRIKRLLRETFRTNKSLPAVDIIMLARPGIGKISNAVINAKLGKAWNKLSVSYEK